VRGPDALLEQSERLLVLAALERGEPEILQRDRRTGRVADLPAERAGLGRVLACERVVGAQERDAAEAEERLSAQPPVLRRARG